MVYNTHTAKILDGKVVREARLTLLKDRLAQLSTKPVLVIIQVGKRTDSDAFIGAKRSFAQKLGISEIYEKLDEQVSQSDLIAVVQKYNKDKKISGIIVQLPLPAHINTAEVIESVDFRKDIDGLTTHSLFTPATTRGIQELFEYYKIDLKGKKVTMVGKSTLVGKPTAQMCEDEGAIVTLCDKKTIDLPSQTQKADIVIVAIGQPRFIGSQFLKKGQVVIDIGITRMPDGTLSGDVDFENVKNIAAAITPVPGGVGQMTVLALFENLIDACYNAGISN